MVESVSIGRTALVGGGRLGRSILRSLGSRIVAAAVRGNGSAAALRAIDPSVVIHRTLAGLASEDCSAVWIATADGAIASVAAELAAYRSEWGGTAVIHSSGATSVAALDPFRARGAMTLALHPNGSFTGHAALPTGLVWGITSRDAGASAFARALLAGLDPVLVPVDDERRPLYHAAASAASNYALTLFAIACDLYRRAGFTEEQAREVVAGFMAAGAENGRLLGPHAALTGPIVRGDIDVLRAQMRGVEEYAPEYLGVLMELALRTAAIADERNRMEEEGGEDQNDESGSPEAQRGQRSGGTGW